jgi:hypothetical protein
VKLRGLAAIDMRTVAAREMIGFRDELVVALGGESELSPQRRKLVDLAARAALYVDHIDGWLAEQRSLINHRSRSVLPVLVQRQAVADHLARLLDKLGLDRVPRRVKSLGEYLAEKYTDSPANDVAAAMAAGEAGRGDVPSGPVIGEEDAASSPIVDVRLGDTPDSGRQNPGGSHPQPGGDMEGPRHCTRCSDVDVSAGHACRPPYGDIGTGTPATEPSDFDGRVASPEYPTNGHEDSVSLRETQGGG